MQPPSDAARITLLITRPEPQGSAFARMMQAVLDRPLRTVLSPVMQIVPVDVTLDTIPGGLILTSVNGVAAARRANLPKGLTAWCVGDRTAQAAAEAGFDAISSKGDSSALIRAILAARPAGPLLHLHGAHTTGDVAATLLAGGVPCIARTGYRQVDRALTPEARAVLVGPDPVILPLFSPRSVSILAKQGPFSAPLHVVAISPAVASVAESLAPARLVGASSPDAAAMFRAIRTLLEAISLATGP